MDEITPVQSTLEALYAGIITEPDDDTRRLVYADALEEASDSARAEFIRASILLEGAEPKDWTIEQMRTHNRRTVLLNAHRAEWLRAGPCEKCVGRGGNEPDDRNTWACRTCGGSGDRGGLLRKFTTGRIEDGTSVTEPVRVEFGRGFPYRVEVPTLACCVYEKTIGMSAHGPHPTKTEPTDWLRSVMSYHPVTEVVPLCRVPFKYISHRFDTYDGYVWYDNRRPVDSAITTPHLPPMVFDWLEGWDEIPSNRHLRGYRTAELGVAALGRAIAQFGRKA